MLIKLSPAWFTDSSLEGPCFFNRSVDNTVPPQLRGVGLSRGELTFPTSLERQLFAHSRPLALAALCERFTISPSQLNPSGVNWREYSQLGADPPYSLPPACFSLRSGALPPNPTENNPVLPVLETQLVAAGMPPPRQEETGWQIFVEEINRRIQLQVHPPNAPLDVEDGPLCFDGLSDSEVLDLADNLLRLNINLDLPWQEVKNDVFFQALAIQTRRRIARLRQQQVAMGMNIDEATESEEESEYDTK